MTTLYTRQPGDVLAWHFTGEKLRDGRPVPKPGEWLTHEGAINICESGLHASVRLIDALGYAPGANLHRVVMRGDMGKQSDKIVARQRLILWSIDAEYILRRFACECALDVSHLWSMPGVVRQYLETMDDRLQDAAQDAIQDAARSARAAVWGAEWEAIQYAARAAWAKVWDASRSARASAGGATQEAKNKRITSLAIWQREEAKK
jgi:hypothetical protein